MKTSDTNLPLAEAGAHPTLVRPDPVPGTHAAGGTVRSGVVVSREAYQPRVPGAPLKGPVTSAVIQPP